MERFEEGVANASALDDDVFYGEGDLEALVDEYKRHLLQMQMLMNRRFAEWHRDYPAIVPVIRVNVGTQMEMGSMLIRNETAGYAAPAMRDGRRMYDESLETVLDLYETLYLKGHTQTIAAGGTNLGKTSGSHFLRLVAGLLNDLIFHEKTCIINIYITRRNIVNQSQESFKALVALYGSVEITCQRDGRQQRHTLGAYHKGAVVTIFDRGFENERFNDLNQARNQEEIVKIARTAKQKGMPLLVEVDEIHHGPRATGALGLKMPDLAPEVDDDPAYDPSRSMSKTLEAVRDLISPKAIVGFSATPDLTLDDCWHVVPMRYSPIYASPFLWYRGFRIADIQIPVWGHAEFFQYTGIDLSTIETGILNDATARAEMPERIEEMYWTALQAVEWCFNWGYDQERAAAVPDFNPARCQYKGAMIRLERSNDRCDEFADFIETHSHIKVLRFYNTKRNKNRNKGNIRAQLTALIQSGEYFVVLATGALRMADDLPKDVVYFFDYTGQTKYPVALRQGTPGRSSGHGKVSLLILSDANAAGVRRNDEENKSRYPQTNPSQHTTMGRGRGRPAGQDNTLHRQARIVMGPNTPEELLALLPPFQRYLEAEAIRVFSMVPDQIDRQRRETMRFSTLRAKGNLALPAPDSHFRVLLPALEQEFIRQRAGTVADVVFLGFDGDEIPLVDGERGPSIRSFDPTSPYSLRDHEKVDRSGVRAVRAKAWRSRGGMIIQLGWDIVDPQGKPAKIGTLRIVEIIWPIKSIRAADRGGSSGGPIPQPKAYTWPNRFRKGRDDVE